MSVTTFDEVSDVTGVTADELRQWHRLGLLGHSDELDREAVERARLVMFAGDRGVVPDELARINKEQGDLLGRFVRWALRPGREVSLNRDDAATKAGIDRELLDQMLVSTGSGDKTDMYEEDVDALRLVKTALDFGLPTDALLEILRVLADTSAKAAETIVRVFHLHVHERMRAEGLSGEALMDATESLALPMAELVEPAIMYYHRTSWEQANRDDLLLHLLEETTPPAAVTGELYRTILFVDLSSFTPLTEAMGDDAAAKVIRRFSDMVREAAASCDGHVIKQIGDEFMLVFPTETDAVSFGVAMRRAAAAEPQFPALRIGAHAGSVLYREGDYIGANVNLAARVTSAAERNQFLVTAPIATKAPQDGLEFQSQGEVRLKGIADPVELFAVDDLEILGAKHTDPICGMELDEASAEAQLTWQGKRLLFCSRQCLRLFLDRSTGTGTYSDPSPPTDNL